MGELGLTAAPFPQADGGGGFSYVGWTLVMEELGAADMSSAVTLSVHVLSLFPVIAWGSADQKARSSMGCTPVCGWDEWHLEPLAP